MASEDPPAPTPARAVVAPPPRNGAQAIVRRVASDELLGARGELVIAHQGRDYRLRITQNGKLILTA
jgi:hemin uptake protein HemP